MLGWLEDTVSKMSINFRKKSYYDFVTTLLDLFLYDNEGLTKSIFEMLHKTFH